MARSLVGSAAWNDMIEEDWARLLARFPETMPSQLEVGSRGSHLLSAAFGSYPKGSSPKAAEPASSGSTRRSTRARPGLSLRLGGGGSGGGGGAAAGCFSPTHGPSRGGHTPRAAAAAAARRDRLAAEASAAAPAPNKPVSILSFDAATPTRVVHLTLPDESPVVERPAGTSPRSRARAALLRAEEAASASPASSVSVRRAGTSPRSRRAAKAKQWELGTGTDGARLQEVLKQRHEQRSGTPERVARNLGSIGRQEARGARALRTGDGSVSLSPAQHLGPHIQFDSDDLGSSGAWSDSGADSPRLDGGLTGTVSDPHEGSPLRTSYTPPAPRSSDSPLRRTAAGFDDEDEDVVVAETYVGAGMQGLPMYDPDASQRQSMTVAVARDGTLSGVKKKKVANFSTRQARAHAGAAADADRFQAAQQAGAGPIFGRQVSDGGPGGGRA